MKEEDLRKLTNEELDNLLNKADWCDKELLQEHDDRCHDGRIEFEPIPQDNLEEFIRNKYAQLKRRKAS